MQGHVYQAVTLTVFGNEHLCGIATAPSPDGAVAFRYSRSTVFVDGPRQPGHENPLLASDPAAWFALLKQRGIRAIRLHHVPGDGKYEDYNTVVFGGGGRWLIETATETQSDFWQSHSEVVDEKAPDRRIWGDTVHRVAVNWKPRPVPFADMTRARADLAAVLPEVLAFAKAHEEKRDFAEFFERGIAALSSASPLNKSDAPDIDGCESLTLPARQLLGAAGASWVFGGMSWWNDGGVRDPEANKTYLALTQQLWNAVTNAIVAGANSNATAL
jgi:hypothetical protein